MDCVYWDVLVERTKQGGSFLTQRPAVPEPAMSRFATGSNLGLCCYADNLNAVELGGYDELSSGKLTHERALKQTIDNNNRDGANAVPTNRNYTAELLTFGVIARVS